LAAAKATVKPTINGIPVPDHSLPSAAAGAATAAESLPYPPVHLLASVVGRLWKEKESLPLISFDCGIPSLSPSPLSHWPLVALRLLSAKPSSSVPFSAAAVPTISLPYFLCLVCEAWAVECETILNKIKIKKYSNSRRHGLKPLSTPFTVSSHSLSSPYLSLLLLLSLPHSFRLLSQKSSSSLTVADKKTLQFIYHKYADKTVSSFENFSRLPADISENNSVASTASGDTQLSRSQPQVLSLEDATEHKVPLFLSCASSLSLLCAVL
jgi:hypothetical protein